MPLFFHKVGRLYVNFASHGFGFRTFPSMLNKYAAVAYGIFDLHHENCKICLSVLPYLFMSIHVHENG